jgi:hypothetical protein
MTGTERSFAAYSASLQPVARALQRHVPTVARAARTAAVDPELLFGILVLEHLNRGPAHRCLERVLAAVWPSYLVSRDCSIGVAQIRLSTACRLTLAPPRPTIKALLNDAECISTCAMLIAALEDRHSLNLLGARRRVEAVSRLYQVGRLDGPLYPWVAMHSALLLHSVSSRIYHRLSERR